MLGSDVVRHSQQAVRKQRIFPKQSVRLADHDIFKGLSGGGWGVWGGGRMGLDGLGWVRMGWDGLGWFGD